MAILSAFARLHPMQRARLLLLPIAPLLGWGPLTHCYLNYRARKQLLAERPDDPLLRDDSEGREFIQHAVSPDVITAYHFIYRSKAWAYAHNPLPNRYYGRPAMGQALWAEARTPVEQRLALGWLAHQIADQFAHNVPFERFFGYVNREAYFGYYWDEVMAHLGIEHDCDLGGAFFAADHWVSELIIDAYVYATLGAEFDPAFVIQRRPVPFALLERASRRLVREEGDRLAAESGTSPQPLERAALARCREFCDSVNAGTYHYIRALVAERGAAALRASILADRKFRHLPLVLDLVVGQVVKMLRDPAASYQPIELAEFALVQPPNGNGVLAGPPLTHDREAYWSRNLYESARIHAPRGKTSLHRMLELAPMPLVRWTLQRVPVTAYRGPLARRLIPQTRTNLGLSLRYALRLREGNWETLGGAMEEVLQEKGLLSPGPRLRVRTF